MREKSTPYSDPTLAEYYAKASAKYQFHQPAHDLVAHLKISPGQRILDVGSGSGLIASGASLVTGSSGFVCALDGSIEMLKQQKTNGVIRVVANAQDLPFENDTFDRVAAGFVITHLPDHSQGLSEWTRVLRPNGFLAATVWQTGAIKVSEVWKNIVK